MSEPCPNCGAPDWGGWWCEDCDPLAQMPGPDDLKHLST